LIRQLVISLVILLMAFAAWLTFVPGSRDLLATYGITLPFAPEQPAPPGQIAQAAPPGQPRPGGGGRVTNVVTTAVGISTINDGLSAIGEGRSFRSVTVSSSAGGTLEELLVSPGHEVEAGATIGRLDADDQQVAYDLALLAVEDTRATVARTEGLATNNVVATTALTAARLASATAELDLRNAQNNLDRRTITSPISGTVGLMQVTPGNYLTAQTTVTTVDDNSSILVNFWVPERYAASLRTDMPVSVSAVALPGRVFDGTISAIDNRIDPASRTLQVQASIPNDDGLMRAGMSFVVSLAFPGEQFPTVNPLAILWSADGSYVWKYDQGIATRVAAEIVQRNSDGVLVRGDLAPGDAIITEGILQLSEGATVTLLEGPDGTTTTTEEAAASAAPAQPI